MIFKFVSTKKVYAETRAILESYFSVGAMDDMLFDTWVSRAIERLGMTAKRKRVAVVKVSNYTGVLPDDVAVIQDVWVCDTSHTNYFQDPTSTYYQEDYVFENQCEDKCNSCKKGDEDNCYCAEEYPKCNVVHKVTGTTVFSFKRQRRLVPGDYETRDMCEANCPILRVTSNDTFHISGCHIHTSLKEATLNVYYFANVLDGEGNLMIPDNTYIHEYLVKLLISKLYEKLLSNTHDETYNQVRDKMLLYQKEAKDAYMNMETRLKMPSEQKWIEGTRRQKNKFNRLRRRYY